MVRRSLRLTAAAAAVLPLLTASPAGAAGQPGPADTAPSPPAPVAVRIEVGALGDGRLIVARAFAGDAAEAASVVDDALSAATIQSHTERCYYARPTWTRRNGFGKLSSRAWYYIEWCARAGLVTRLLTLHCGGVAAGGFSYDGCSVRRGATGFSKLHVSGTWKFPFRVGIYTFITRTVTVSARHYATGRYAGTWWMYQ